MPRAAKRLAEKLYGSSIGWEGWTFHIVSSRLGVQRIEVSSVSLADLAEHLRTRILPDDVPNEAALRQVREYLRGERRSFDLPLDLQGTAFQLAVWRQVATIPYAATSPYGDLARALGRDKATRAVGQAVGANPVAIVIPCHRVVGKSGGLTGYRGGLPLKERLLALERGSLSL
ncbi:MAG: methylated-DNA--[protein]-cysteine S-methyltransferase [Candidatus Bipolaricaulota bacterium]